MQEPIAPSVLSSWTRTIVDAVVAMDGDAEAVLRDAGISSMSFSDPNGRLPVASTSRLWRAAAEHMRDPAFGLRASRYVRQTTFHALGYAVFASATLRDALERLVRYGRLVSDAGSFELQARVGSARLSFVYPSDRPAPCLESIDAVTSLIVRTCRTLTDRSFALQKVELRRPVPDDETPYHRFFRSPVLFGADVDALTCDAEVLDAPLPSANPELANHNDDLVQRHLAQMRGGTISERIRAALAESLSGDASPATTAAALGMSVRSLQRRLQEQGTTYAAILSDTRKEQAHRHLREAEYSVTEIAFLLGFEDASAFARAFRRWTGKSPTEFRKHSKGTSETRKRSA